MDMKRQVKRALCGALAALMLNATSCALLPAEEVLPDAPITLRDDTATFTMTYVKRGDLVREQRFGVVYRAVRQEQLRFQVGGLRIEEVYVQQGDSVKAGDKLMVLEQGDLPQKLSDAQDKCDTLALQLKQAEENLERSRDEYELQLKYMTEKEREEADSMEEHLRDQNRSIDRMKDSLKLARMEADKAAKELDKRALRAGIDGVVTYVRGVQSDSMSSMTENMVVLSDSASSMFVVNTDLLELFPEGATFAVEIGDMVYPSVVVSAREAGVEEGKKEVYLKSDIPTVDLSDGETGQFYVEMERCDDILYVESSAVKSMDGKHFVYVQDENGLRSTQEVTVGREINNKIEIKSGLKEGDALILR